MSIPRGLSETEAAAWAHIAQSVTPLEGRARPVMPKDGGAGVKTKPKSKTGLKMPPPVSPARAKAKAHPKPPPPGNIANTNLDSHWERKLKSGRIVPDYTLDLHGHTLDSAYTRLSRGLDQARAMDARVVLVIAGRSRPVDPADRGSKRGAIRAKLLDWLAAGPHADAISAVRKAHRGHGGEGALYLVLKRRR
ncbi:MAG: Smr/MutS family protein [Pseudomonadota bacterium]